MDELSILKLQSEDRMQLQFDGWMEAFYASLRVLNTLMLGEENCWAV